MPFYTKIGNFEAVTVCSVGSSLLGVFLMLVGAVITGLAYTEITPPDYDENYKRYIGSNLMRIIGKVIVISLLKKLFLTAPFILGPLSLGFGGILLLGSCGLFTFAFVSEYRKDDDRHIDYQARLDPEEEKLRGH